MPRPKKPVAPAPQSTPPTAELAYEKVLAEIEAVPDEHLIAVNLDIPQSVATVLGKLEAIRAYEEELVSLKGLDARCVERLPTYAQAAWHAYLMAQPAPPQTQVRALIDEATELRANLLVEADVLVRRGVFDAQAIAAIRAGQGYVDLANDLSALAPMYRKVWADIQGHAYVSEREINRAAVLGLELLSAVGVRAGGGAASEHVAADLKLRAFALFVRAYDEVRRGLAFLRWHEDDAEEIAPSLYRKGTRSSGKAESKSDVVAPPVAETPAPPLVNGAAQPA
jgi:hypothetical protein